MMDPGQRSWEGIATLIVEPSFQGKRAARAVHAMGAVAVRTRPPPGGPPRHGPHAMARRWLGAAGPQQGRSWPSPIFFRRAQHHARTPKTKFLPRHFLNNPCLKRLLSCRNCSQRVPLGFLTAFPSAWVAHGAEFSSCAIRLSSRQRRPSIANKDGSEASSPGASSDACAERDGAQPSQQIAALGRCSALLTGRLVTLVSNV